MSLRILLADDHVIVRQAIKAVLEKEGFRVVAEAEDGREAVKLAGEVRPDLAVLDISMPQLNGVDAGREIRKCSPRTKIVLLTLRREAPYVREALRAGLRGYVLKAEGATDLIEAVNRICRGETYVSPLLGGTFDEMTKRGERVSDPLTSRERQILQLIAEGKSTKEIAALLNLSFNTVESHRTRIMNKLGIHGRAGLVRYAIRCCLIPP